MKQLIDKNENFLLNFPQIHVSLMPVQKLVTLSCKSTFKHSLCFLWIPAIGEKNLFFM